MPNAAVVTDKAPGAGAPYSQGVSSGSMLFVSGQTGKSIETGKLAEGGLEGQAEQTLKNLGAVLEAGGCTYADCVKCTVLLTDMANFDRVNKVYLVRIPSSVAPPRRSPFAQIADSSFASQSYFTEKPLPSRMCYAGAHPPLSLARAPARGAAQLELTRPRRVLSHDDHSQRAPRGRARGD